MKDQKRKPDKIWVDKHCEYYSKPMKKWIKDNKKVINQLHNKG